MKKRNKKINDTIHGVIEIDADAISILDTPEFKRLHQLRQLGAVYYVYPTANHTRAEHCIGVYKLTRDYLEHLTSPFHNYTNS
jgi:HD superfamily phosphohydrolase